MNKTKQIEEMAKDICRVEERCIVGCQPTLKCRAFKYAERAYTAGYRKATDVAREIFEEIECLIWQNDTHPAGELTEQIAELKKKYTEGGE